MLEIDNSLDVFTVAGGVELGLGLVCGEPVADFFVGVSLGLGVCLISGVTAVEVAVIPVEVRVEAQPATIIRLNRIIHNQTFEKMPNMDCSVSIDSCLCISMKYDPFS